MKRKLVGVICACLLFLGCEDISSQSIQTMPPATEIPTATSNLPLLEQGIALEENGSLLYIPNPTVESMTAPDVRLFGNGLLLSKHTGNVFILNHISLEDGTLVTSASIHAGVGTKLYIGGGEIGLCDRKSGLISILDETFRLQRTYDVADDGDEWYLNSELDTLFIFFSDRGLLVRNLESGEEFWLVENGFRVTPVGSGNGYVIFTYTDRADQKTYSRCLNLSMATLETLPVVGSATEVTRQGENWLIRDSEVEGLYSLVHRESARSFRWTDSAVRLLSPRRHLLATDLSGRNLILYETDGAFLSRCALPQNSNAVVGWDFVWSGYWGGYFFTDFIDSSCRLMFWDVSADSEGEDLEMSSLEQNPQVQPVLEPPLYERAEQLSQRFGVEIRIAEQCTLDYSHYDTYALTDPVFIRSALDILEESLSQYPEGFFRQLHYGSIESIRMELVGGLTAKDDVDSHPNSVGAFAQDRGSYYTIVLDGFLLQPQTLFHEFSHIIDKRLEWDSFVRTDALYSEEGWLALQPEGFRYAFSYTEVPEELLRHMESGCFVTEYAMTFPTEDRATLLEAAMNNYSWDFESGSGRRAKLQYYADCIRDCFDTTGWPEVTLWEQVLK